MPGEVVVTEVGEEAGEGTVEAMEVAEEETVAEAVTETKDLDEHAVGCY